MTERAISPSEPVRYELVLPGIRFAAWRWSPPPDVDPTGRQIVILHGVTANALAFGAVARAFAGDGWTVDALDLPGHGGTRWTDGLGAPLEDQETVDPAVYGLRHVGELVAAAMGLLRAVAPSRTPAGPAGDVMASDGSSAPWEPPVLLGHSWGAGVAVMAVDAGAPAEQLVLLDPPFLTPREGAEMAEAFHSELRQDLDVARALVRSWGPGWTEEDVEAKAHALVDTSPKAADAISRGAPWDPVQLMTEWRERHPDLRVDIVAGDPAAGGLVPVRILELLRMALGPARLHELPGLGHSPHREDLRGFLAVLRQILG